MRSPARSLTHTHSHSCADESVCSLGSCSCNRWKIRVIHTWQHTHTHTQSIDMYLLSSQWHKWSDCGSLCSLHWQDQPNWDSFKDSFHDVIASLPLLLTLDWMGMKETWGDKVFLFSKRFPLLSAAASSIIPFEMIRSVLLRAAHWQQSRSFCLWSPVNWTKHVRFGKIIRLFSFKTAQIQPNVSWCHVWCISFESRYHHIQNKSVCSISMQKHAELTTRRILMC